MFQAIGVIEHVGHTASPSRYWQIVCTAAWDVNESYAKVWEMLIEK
jgi:hypothetical protein